MKRLIAISSVGLLLGSCGPAEDVDVQPLPELERPSREARLGIPEIAGSWSFAGWEMLRGDSVSLERTFPSFGALEIATQRLDSIAGSFLVAGGATPVVGEVRRDGGVALVTLPGGAPLNYLTGKFQSDTLWLELSSILAPGEWPQNSRAAFVRDTVAEPIAWIRGARPTPEVEPDTTLMDGVVPTDSGQAVVPSTQRSQVPGALPANSRPAGPATTTPSQPRPASAPAPSPTRPPSTGNTQPAAAPAPDPDPAPAEPQQPAEPEPEPEPAPEPEIEPTVTPQPEPDLPPLLGDPVQ